VHSTWIACRQCWSNITSLTLTQQCKPIMEANHENCTLLQSVSCKILKTVVITHQLYHSCLCVRHIRMSFCRFWQDVGQHHGGTWQPHPWRWVPYPRWLSFILCCKCECEALKAHTRIMRHNNQIYMKKNFCRLWQHVRYHHGGSRQPHSARWVPNPRWKSWPCPVPRTPQHVAWPHGGLGRRPWSCEGRVERLHEFAG
jgi:hypothetical protein